MMALGPTSTEGWLWPENRIDKQLFPKHIRKTGSRSSSRNVSGNVFGGVV